MKTKQACLLPVKLRVEECEWGGYIVSTGQDSEARPRIAAFSTADECADWIRQYLRNQAEKKLSLTEKRGKT